MVENSGPVPAILLELEVEVERVVNAFCKGGAFACMTCRKYMSCKIQGQ